MDISLALLTGINIPFEPLQIDISQPIVEDISRIGEKEFFQLASVLCIDKRITLPAEVQEKTTNYDVFLQVMNSKDNDNMKQRLENLFVLLLPEWNIGFTPNSMLLTQKIDGQIVSKSIDKIVFEQFQDIIKRVVGLDNQMNQQKQYNPKGKAAEEITRKIMEGRKKVSAQSGESSIFAPYLSGLSVAFGVSPKVLMKLTTFQLFDLMKRYSLKQDYDMNIKVRLAGGDPKKDPENWLKDMYNQT